MPLRRVIPARGAACCAPTRTEPVEQKSDLVLLIKSKRRGLIIASQVELDAVVHPPRARSAFRRTRRGFSVDPRELIFRRGIRPFELQHRKSAAFLGGM